MNVLFDAGSLKVTGYNREKLPYERELKNIEQIDINNIYNLSYEDVLEIKRQELIRNDLFNEAILFGILDYEMFVAHANFGWDFIVFKPNNFAMTKKIDLPLAANIVRVYLEFNVPELTIEVGEDDSSLKHVNEYNEVYFNSKVSSVIVKMSNSTPKTIEVSAFGLLLG